MLCVLVAVLVGSPGGAVAGQYTESFASKAYCDTSATTARWDTLAGEISLHPLPMLLGSTDTPGDAKSVAISGNRAYVADASSGLRVLDITDPTNPLLTGGWNTPGTARNAVVDGDHVFLADGGQGLRVLDVSDPDVPTSTGWLDTDDAWDVEVDGDHAFVADDQGLLVIDISVPASPVLPSGASVSIPGARAVAVAGNFAYVVSVTAPRFHVVDVSDPTTPSLVASLGALASPSDVVVDGDVAFVSDGILGLVAIDVSRPTAPVVRGSVPIPGGGAAVVVDGDIAYVAGGSGALAVIDVSEPLSPGIPRSVALPSAPTGVALGGHHAYVSCGADGVVVLKRSEEVAMVSEGVRDFSGSAYDVAVSGNTALIAAHSAGLVTVDVTSPANPGYHYYVWEVTTAVAVDVAGEHAFVIDEGFGLWVINLSDLEIAGSCSLAAVNRAVTVSGDYAYVACGNDGLAVVDVQDPMNPVFVAGATTPSHAYGLDVAGNYAYVACGDDGLQVFDISVPTAPSLVGACAEADFAMDVAVDGNYAFIAGGPVKFLVVVDVSDPTNPTYVTDTVGGAYQADHIRVSGDRAYVTDWGGDLLRAYDVSAPWNPMSAGLYYASDDTRGFAIAGDLAFVAVAGEGLEIVRMSQSVGTVESNTVQSVDIEPAGEEVTLVSLRATTTDSIRWELSADGGANWTVVPPDGTWNELTYPGSELLWRSTHVYQVGGGNPTCTDLSIEWWDEELPAIASIVDIGNDQGGQVSLSWWRSRYDAFGSDLPIIEYAVYRRIDGARITPPGSWHHVMTVPACGEEHYATVVPTLHDSTATGGMHWSVFFVSALTATPGVYFDSAPDSGYSIDNLSPEMPGVFSVDYGADENHLSWSESEAPDFGCFHVYRGVEPDFVPGAESLVHVTEGLTWTDEVEGGWQYHYLITALDEAGNESDPSAPEEVTGVEAERPPVSFALHQNVPNPFGCGTSIGYDVPEGGGHVRIEIFDVAGRLVRVLVDRREKQGRREVVWDGRNWNGRRVPAGIYYCRLRARGYTETRKLTVSK